MEAVLAIAAVLAAVAAGVTGAWSPCGFSMVDTLGAATRVRGRRAMRVACATFTVGALAGGVITFGALATVGALLHAGDSAVAIGVAVAVAVVAAGADAAGLRIAPQIRRQVPEGWRHTMPLSLVAGLYGVLLGLGFTTFVLAFAVWALAGISIALGDPVIGVLIGLGFGLGRALPVVVMAPRLEGAGERLLTAMAERPRLLYRLRRLDAALLVVLAIAIAAGPAAATPVPLSGEAVDPSVDGDTEVWRTADGAVLVRWPGRESRISGATTGAAAGPYVVSDAQLLTGRGIAVDLRDALPPAVDRATPVPVLDPPPLAVLPASTVNAVAASGDWVAWRAERARGGDEIVAARLPSLGEVRVVARLGPAGQLSRPALDGRRLVYALNTPRGSSIVLVNLETGARRVLRTSHTLVQYRDPSIRGDRLLSVVAGYCDQALRWEPLLRPALGRTLLRLGTNARRDLGYVPGRTRVGSSASRCPSVAPPRTGEVLDATALTPTHAYATVSRPAPAGIDAARIMQVPLVPVAPAAAAGARR